MGFLETIDEWYVSFLSWFRRKIDIETEEPQQDEAKTPDSNKPVVDERLVKFQKAFEQAKRLSRQGIEENADKDLIKKWWAQVGKAGYSEKTPWCTLGVHIPLMDVGLLKLEDLPRNVALARGYFQNMPKGFKRIAVADLQVGDIAIKWRGTASSGGGPNGWMGHTGWFDGYTDDKKGYYSIGGNQSNQFNRKIYESRKLLGGVRVVGGTVESIDDEMNVDLTIDKKFVPERFRQRALDMTRMYLLARETRNQNDIKWAYKKAIKNKERYQKLSKDVGLPWQAIAAIHYLESSFRFSRHLHNGDPLTARTTRVPEGRPKKDPANGVAYTFEESAHDVFNVLKKKPNKWTLPNLMYYLESYNGMGYYFRGLNSSYMVAGTQFQQGGKYVADHVFDPNAYSKRGGVIILMKKLGYEPL